MKNSIINTIKTLTNILLVLLFASSSTQAQTFDDKQELRTYYDKPADDTVASDILVAITAEEYLEPGVEIAYVNLSGDTVIPYGKYTYIDTDTLEHYAHVAMRTEGDHDKWVAIDHLDNILYDVFIYDNGPDYLSEGLVRVRRNGKMGFANKYGQIVIPCVYDFANYFEDGKAKVTYDCKFTTDGEHTVVTSDSWFYISNNGKKVE